jgi:ParB family chromosome partitioning protein
VSEDKRRRSLGRGLSALLGDDPDDFTPTERNRNPRSLPTDQIQPGRFQPRRHFDEESLQGLVDSIRDKGVLQPLLVRRISDAEDSYELIAGERRWRAAQMAQLHEVPVVIRDFDDAEALEIALIENIQRQDLTPLEEAEGYRRLMDEFGHTQEMLAQTIGKSRSHVANTLRLLTLDEPVKAMLGDGRLTAGHARALLTADNPSELAAQIVEQNMNVRQAEQLVQTSKGRSSPLGKSEPGVRPPKPEKSADALGLERDLGNLLGLKVEINFSGHGGALVIHYRTLEQLDDVLNRLSQVPKQRSA